MKKRRKSWKDEKEKKNLTVEKRGKLKQKKLDKNIKKGKKNVQNENEY